MERLLVPCHLQPLFDIMSRFHYSTMMRRFEIFVGEDSGNNWKGRNDQRFGIPYCITTPLLYPTPVADLRADVKAFTMKPNRLLSKVLKATRIKLSRDFV